MSAYEDIGDDCRVCRLLEHPKDFDAYGEVVWRDQVFMFQDRACESHVWRKYARTDRDVHQIGHETTKRKNALRNREEIYHGFGQALAGDIRGVRHSPEDSEEVYSFVVNHEPYEDEEFLPYHAHVCFCRLSDRRVLRPPGKNIRRTLRNSLAEIFRETFVPVDSASGKSSIKVPKQSIKGLLRHFCQLFRRTNRRH